MDENMELQHWGIKGQKWGIRRYQNPDGTLTAAGKKRYYYQNPDGSLTEEGKKNYMTAARKGKINPKKLSDADLDMINKRFAKESTYAQNVQKYRESTFSYKAKQAVINRIRGKGNGEGGGGKGGKGGKGIGSLLAMPIKKALEDALKFDPEKGGGNNKDDSRGSKEDRWYDNYVDNGHRFVTNGNKNKSISDFATDSRINTGKRFMGSDYTRPVDNPFKTWNTSRSTSAEDAIRSRHGYTTNRRKVDWDNTSNKRKKKMKRAAAHFDFEEEYLMHRETLVPFVIRRSVLSDE